MIYLPPAGWYPNPSGAPGQRYFDGRDWTAHHRATPPQPMPAPSTADGHANQRRGHRTQPRTARRPNAADLLGVRWLGMDMVDRRLEQPSSRACGDHTATAATVNDHPSSDRGSTGHPHTGTLSRIRSAITSRLSPRS